MITDEELNSWSLEQLRKEWRNRSFIPDNYPYPIRDEMDQIEKRVREGFKDELDREENEV